MYMILKFNYGVQRIVPLEDGITILKALANGAELDSDNSLITNLSKQQGVDVKFCDEQTFKDIQAFQALAQT